VYVYCGKTPGLKVRVLGVGIGIGIKTIKKHG
jgi:hypothetical protein